MNIQYMTLLNLHTITVLLLTAVSEVHCTLNEKEGSMPHSESHQKHTVVHWVFKHSDSLLAVCLQLTEDNFSYLAFSTVLSSSNVI